ncbi:MAG TPA: amino acid permease [Patescibacteria group bacterium]|jgi:amino acid transporter|nr:amino acid permease [Patescibacteria group bacterium]
MATAAATMPEVFVRKSSGLVRVMSPRSAFVYNVLTMGLIFPWTYLWAPAVLPGGQLVWGILLAMLLEIPIALAYVWLSTALPRSGGDYVFQSRVLGGGIGFTLVFSGFVIWILQWVALSGWLLATLGFAPLFLGLGASSGNTSLVDLATWFTTPIGIVVTSVANALVAMLILISGFKNYVRLQRVMWVAILVSFGTMLAVLFTTAAADVPAKLNAFSAAIGGSSTFYGDSIAAAQAGGVNLNPAFSLVATLLVAPIAWTSLQWATYSAQQNGEIKSAGSFRDQLFIIVGSLVLTGVLLAILAWVLENTVGTQFLYVAGAGYWGYADVSLAGSYLWPNIIATALANNPIVTILIAIGFILNGHQIVHNCYIGMTRVMVAMSLDRLLPEWVSRVSDRFHTPVNAHLVYFIASLPVIWLYSNFALDNADGSTTTWASITLGVTFGCGYVFIGTALAGALLPFRAKALYESSPGSKYTFAGIPLVTIVGLIGTAAGLYFLYLFLLSPELGMNSTLAYTVSAGVLVFALGWYVVTKLARRSSGINVDYAFKEIPPE